MRPRPDISPTANEIASVVDEHGNQVTIVEMIEDINYWRHRCLAAERKFESYEQIVKDELAKIRREPHR